LPQWKTLAVLVLFIVIFRVWKQRSVKLLELVFGKMFIDKNKEILTGLLCKSL
jgi:hypothetical protein